MLKVELELENVREDTERAEICGRAGSAWGTVGVVGDSEGEAERM
jgi:hypothetical protein